MSTKLQVSKAVTKKNTATGGPVQSPGKVQNGTKKKSTEAAPKPRTSSGDGPPGGEVRKSSRPRKAKVWFEEGADATEEGADPVKYVGNNLDGEDVDNQKHEDEAEANGKSGDVGENEVDEAVDEAGDEPEEEDLAEDDAEEKADEEEGDEAEEEEGDEAEEEEGDEAEEEEGDEAEEEEDDEAEEEQDDEVEEEEDEESEEGQGDEDEAEKGSEKGDSAEVGEGADAHKPQITRKGSFDEMLEEQGDADDEDMEDEAVAEERAMLLGKLKALDEIKEPVVSSKPARKGVKRLPRSEPSKVPAKPPRGKDAVTSAKGKDKVLATDSILGGKSKREFALVVGGAQKKQNTGEVSAKPKSTPTAAGAGTSGGKAKAGAGASGVKAKAGAGASGVKAKAGAGTSGVKAKAGAGTSGVKAKAGAGAKPTSKEANTKTKGQTFAALYSTAGWYHFLFVACLLMSRRFPSFPAVAFLPSMPSPSSHPCRHLHPIPAVPFIPSLPSPSSHPCRHLHPIPAVTFIPSLPSPSSHPCRPLQPIPAVTSDPSLSHLSSISSVPYTINSSQSVLWSCTTGEGLGRHRVVRLYLNPNSPLLACPLSPQPETTPATLNTGLGRHREVRLYLNPNSPLPACPLCPQPETPPATLNPGLGRFREVMLYLNPNSPLLACPLSPQPQTPLASPSRHREVRLYLNPNSPLLACPLSPQPQTPLASPSRHREVRLYLNPNSPLLACPLSPQPQTPLASPSRHREVRLYLNPNSPLPACPLCPQPETPPATLNPGLGRHREVRLYLNPNSPLLASPLSPQPQTPLASPSRHREVRLYLNPNSPLACLPTLPSTRNPTCYPKYRPREVLASLRALFQHNDASTRGVFFEQLSSTRTSINGWMRKVALTALGRQANKCYLGRLPADLLAPLEFYTDEELIARYKDGERGLAWHRELLIPFGSLIFSVSIKLALARRGVNSEKIKTRQLGWILYAFEWPILNNAPDGKLSGKWEYNRIQYEEMCTRVKREVEIAVIDHGVPYAKNTNTFNFPNGVYIDASDMETLVSRVQVTLLNSSHLIRPLPPISSVPFLPSHPSPSSHLIPPPSSHLIRPLPPISSVPFLPSHPSPSSHLIRPLLPFSSVPFLLSHPSPSFHPLPSPMPLCTGCTTCTSPGCHPKPVITEVSSSTRGIGAGRSSGSSNLQEQHGDRGVAVAVTTSSRSMGTCGAAVAATGQVRSSSGSMGTGAEQQGQQGDRCGAAGAAGGQVRSSSGSIGTGAEQQWQHGDRCGAAVAAWGQVWSSRGSMGTGAEQQWQHGDSAYRVSPSRFVVLAISGLNFTWVTDGEGCRWVGRDGSRVNGSVWYRDFMHPKTQTDSLAAFCQLWGNTSRAGGYLVMTMDGVEAAVFNERPGQPLEPPPDASLPVHLTWCSQPLYGTLDAGRVWVWAEYHRVHANVSRFIFYDMAAWTPALTALFTPYFAAGVAAVTDMSAGRRFGFVAGVELLYFTTKHQTLASNDCIYRSLFTSRWVTLHDTDEYLAPVPPHSLPSLLAAHAHAPWLSHGAFAVKPSVCEGEGGEDAPAPAEAATVEPADSGGGVGGGSAAVEAAGGGGGGGGGGDTRGAGAAVNARSRHEETALGAAGNGTEGGETQWDEAAGTEAKRRAVQLLSRMVFRHPDVWCLRDRAEGQRIDSDLCEDWRGHRKLIVNPRKVRRAHRLFPPRCLIPSLSSASSEKPRLGFGTADGVRATEVMSIHIAREPQKGGVVLNAATELRHFHFSGVVNPVNAHCQTLVPPGESHVWFVRDTTVADKLRLLVNSSAPQPEP
ncbi:unnamed protein product [Closterium sp. NIES-65]|nr:unnamed protein product [Closterium sp. NIES-65]